MKFEIEEVKKRFDLLRHANGASCTLLSDLAKEIGAKKTDFMEYVEANPKLFHTANVPKYRKASAMQRNPFTQKTERVSVKEQCGVVGLGIYEVYVDPKDNWRTDEWLAVQIEKYKQYIYVIEMSNYGSIYGYQILRDSSKNTRREHLWRNTEAKIAEITNGGYLHTGHWYSGSFGDSASGEAVNCITENKLEELKIAGWITNNYQPLR